MKLQPAQNPQPNPRARSAFSDATKRRFQVVIADESPLCRKGLRDLLEEDGRFEIAMEADHGQAALKAILSHKPDVAVLDSGLPGVSAIEVAALLKARSHKTNLVLLASQKDEHTFNQAISLGIKGYVLRRNPPAEILECIAAAARDEAYVSPVLTDLLLRRRGRTDSLDRRQPGLGRLTPAERRVLKYITEGKTSREIAAECGVSPRTVDSHRAHICEKLGLSGSNRLLQFALEHRDSLSHLD